MVHVVHRRSPGIANIAATLPWNHQIGQALLEPYLTYDI